LLEVLPVIVPVKSSLKSINFYLLKADQSLLLIDAGLNNDDCWDALNNTLSNNGFDISDITHIFLTHHHIDHVGLVNRVVSANPIPVFAHPLSFPRLKREPEFIQMRIEFFDQLYREMGCGEAGKKQVEHLRRAAEVNQSQKIECGLYELTAGAFENFKVIEVPGHAPDQMALYNPDTQQLFAGDLLINHISSNALVEPDENGNRIQSLSLHLESMKKCLGLHINTVFSGHGTVIENHRELIERRIVGADRKADKFLSLIDTGCSTANEVAKRYYGDTYERQFSLVMSEVIGHLDYLEGMGKIGRSLKNGVWTYE